jgi:hypothetical protein
LSVNLSKLREKARLGDKKALELLGLLEAQKEKERS